MSQPVVTPVSSQSGSRPTERRAGAAQLALLLAASCLSVLGAVLIAPVLAQVEKHFAGQPGVEVLVPVMLTVPALMIGLVAPFAGIIVDRANRKRLLAGAACYLAYGSGWPTIAARLRAHRIRLAKA